MEPQAILDGILERSSERRTPCGEGDMVWRVWGESGLEKKTVVLLHGGSGSWNHWIRTIPALEDDFHLIVGDLPGCGSSDSAPEPYDAASLARIVSDGLFQLVPEDGSYDMVCFSFGGVISGLVAQAQGKRLRSLTIVGTPILGLTKGGKANDLRAVPADATPREAEPLYRHNLEKLMVHDPAAIDHLAMTLHMENMANVRLRSRGIAARHPMVNDLVGVTCDLNFIFGEHDPTLHPSLAGVHDYVHEQHPDARFEIVPGAGHWVPYETPDAFNDLIRDILSR